MKFPSPVGVRPLTQVPDFKDAAQVFMSFPSPVGVRPLTMLYDYEHCNKQCFRPLLG